MNKFKVFDSNAKKWLDPKDFYINSDGKLCMFNRPVMCEVLEHVIPVFSTGQIDNDGTDLFEGDNVEFQHIDDDAQDWQKSDIREKGVVEGDFGDFDLFDIEFAIKADYIFFKTGSKYEEQ